MWYIFSSWGMSVDECMNMRLKRWCVTSYPGVDILGCGRRWARVLIDLFFQTDWLEFPKIRTIGNFNNPIDRDFWEGSGQSLKSRASQIRAGTALSHSTPHTARLRVNAIDPADLSKTCDLAISDYFPIYQTRASIKYLWEPRKHVTLAISFRSSNCRLKAQCFAIVIDIFGFRLSSIIYLCSGPSDWPWSS